MRYLTFLYILIVLAVLSCAKGGRHPQITSEGTCNSCSLDVDVIWSSRSGDDNLLGTGWPLELGDELWLMGEAFGHSFARFSLKDEESTLISRKGEGPGEFRWIEAGMVHPSGDSVIAVQSHRISYLDMNAREARSYANPVANNTGMAVMDDGHILFAHPRLRLPSAATDNALHLTSPEGRYVRSFRGNDSLYAGGIWPITRGAEVGTAWVLVPLASGFSAELWDVRTAVMLTRLVGEPSWWVPETKTPHEYERMAGRGATVPKLPTGTVGIWEEDTTLFVALRHFDPEHQSQKLEENRVDKRFDGVLLAVRKSTGDIMTIRVFDEFLLGFTDKGHLVLYDEDHGDQPRVRLATVRLRQ